MSFEAINSKPCTRGAEVSVSLRRDDSRCSEPRVYISVDRDLAKQLGWKEGGHVTAHVGRGPDAGKLRLAPVTAGLGGTAIKVQRRGKASNRVGIAIRPWFDYRGARLRARPAEYTTNTRLGFLDVRLPVELAELPALKIAS